MHLTSLLALLPCLPLAAADKVLGAYIFSRHGDRTSKSWPPVSLTALGQQQMFSSGEWYRKNYIDSEHSDEGAPMSITGLSRQRASLSQLDVSSPVDNVLQNSAQALLQGMYPPTNFTETLADGSKAVSPLGGYQYIPISVASETPGGKNPEEAGWLQGGSGCAKAIKSSDSYFDSAEYLETLESTREFYQSLLPVIGSTFSKEEATFENAYTIYDYIHVSTIHNTSIPSADLLTPQVLSRLESLAAQHQWGLAWNASSPERAIAGSLLAGQVLEALSEMLEQASNPAPNKKRLHVQMGPYGTFLSFFGLAKSADRREVKDALPDYASSMVFELSVPSHAADAEKKVNEDTAIVRFRYANGPASDENEPELIPLFGRGERVMAWKDFEAEMRKIAVSSTEEWCEVCGETEGVCAAYVDDAASTASSEKKEGGGVSNVVAGVIGALVTLVVMLIFQTAFMGIAGLRFVKKSKVNQPQQNVPAGKSFEDYASTVGSV